MTPRPSPYRVLAHAVDVGDRSLAGILFSRLMEHRSPRSRAARTVERLVHTLGF